MLNLIIINSGYYQNLMIFFYDGNWRFEFGTASSSEIIPD